MGNISDQEFKAIIVDGNYDTLVDIAQKVGAELASSKLSTSQIRGIFGTVRRIEMDWSDPSRQKQQGDAGKAVDPSVPEKTLQAQREFALLRPRLAYQAKRENGQAVQKLRNVLEPSIIKVNEGKQEGEIKYYKRFRNFVDFFEAILAYHRANGGK